jgi:hypothetical protein
MDTKLQMSIVKLLSGMIGKRMADDFDDDDDYDSHLEDYATTKQNENEHEYKDPAKPPVDKLASGGKVTAKATAVDLKPGQKPKVTTMEGDPKDVLKGILGKIKDGASCEDDPLEEEFKSITKNRRLRK